MCNYTIIQEMKKHLLSVGLIVDEVQTEDDFHRCGVVGKENGKDGSYRVYLDEPCSLWWKNWRTGEKGSWCAKKGKEMTAEEREVWRERNRKLKEAREQEAAERHKEAAQKAESLWASFSSVVSENAYLKRKGILPLGDIRQTSTGTLVLPIWNGENSLISLQFIDDDKGKWFLSGGKVKGGFCSIPSEDGVKSGPVLIAEGYATAASLRMATGHEVLVAFSAGNLCRVAALARAKYPTREIILCADNDFHEDGKTNAGVLQATHAAQDIGAKLAICPLVNGKKADFNDLHIATVDGLERVRECVETAKREIERPRFPAGYFVRELGSKAGLYKRESGNEDEKEYRLGPPIKVLGRTRDEHSNSWGILLEWKDPAGIVHRRALPDESLQRQGTEWAAMLAAYGYSIEPGMHTRFRSFLAGVNTSQFITNTSKVGWYKNRFVLPDRAIGADDGLVVLQSMDDIGDLYKTSGTLEGWQEIARLCSGNDRFTFALCAAFAGPLLNLAGLEGGGFSFEGPSSCGKTTCLQIAASVWGGPAHVNSWRATTNGLEAFASLHNDGLFILDELGQATGRSVSEGSYMLANGHGRLRAAKSGTMRKSATWRLIFISSGELGLYDKMGEDGLTSRAGQEVRFVGIPMDQSDITALNGCSSAASLVASIKEGAGQHYGHAIRAFLDWLVKGYQTMKETLPEAVAEIANSLCPEDAGDQVRRVAQRFAIVRIAGSLAKASGVLPESIDEVTAVSSCFDAWLENRESLGAAEDTAILTAVRHFIEKHGATRFREVDIVGDSCLNQVGFKRKGQDGLPEYLIYPGALTTDVVKGYAKKKVVSVLKEAGWLITNEKKKNTVKVTVRDIGRKAFYLVVIPEDD